MLLFAVARKMLLRFLNVSIVPMLVPCFCLLGALHSALAASTTVSTWVTVGFVRYLCLKKTVSENLSVVVPLTCIMWDM